MVEEKQSFIQRVYCPNPECCCTSFIEVPDDIHGDIQCNECGKEFPALKWLE